jgi:predicted amidohydrolase
MKTKILSNAPAVAYATFTAPCSERLRYAVFKTNAAEMASIYDKTLSSLARKYRVTVVGGSIILPSPSVVNGRLKAGSGPLFNVSPVYKPDGKAHSSLVTKVFLTDEEQDFLSPGDVTELPVFDTPAGKMGVLICADSWFPRSYESLCRRRAELVVVPSFITGDKALDDKWGGYSGFPPPLDVHKADIGTITKSEAWWRYALLGRLPRSGISYGVMSCLRGRLWDLGSDSCISVVRNARPTVAHSPDGAAMVNVWLDR